MENLNNLGEMLSKAMEEALKNRGRCNVLIAGRSGVGKTTLINSVFQGEMGTTGQGRPITQDIREYSKEGIPVTLIDTRGLELAEYQKTADDVIRYIKDRNSDPDPNRHIHIAWVCVSEDSRRVEEGESRLASLVSESTPVLVVITKARNDDGFRAAVQKLLPDARNVIRVRAISEALDEGTVLKPKGLDELVEATMELVPEAHRNAFVAAQKVNIAQKKTRSHKIVAASVIVAAGVGATPIPFSDAFLLIPVQVAMLAGISATFGLKLSSGFLSTLVASAATGAGATYAGRALVGGLLKLIPGIGTLAGGAISGSTAAVMTTAFGEVYVAVLGTLFESSSGVAPSEEEIAKAFKESLLNKG